MIRRKTPAMTRRYKPNPPGQKPKGDLMTIAEYCRKSGKTDPAIRALIYKEKLKIGVHYWRRPDCRRGIMLDPDMVDNYLRGL